MIELDKIMRANELTVAVTAALPAIVIASAMSYIVYRAVMPHPPNVRTAAGPARVAMAELEQVPTSPYLPLTRPGSCDIVCVCMLLAGEGPSPGVIVTHDVSHGCGTGHRHRKAAGRQPRNFAAPRTHCTTLSFKQTIPVTRSIWNVPHACRLPNAW